MSMVAQDLKQLVVPPVQGRSTGLVVDRAEGSWFTTTDGEKWLDMVMGIAVVNTGHSHPKVLAAAKEQMDKLVQGQMALFYTEPPMKLSEKLCEIVPGGMDRVLYANSGAETVENAIKLAKQVTRRPAVIAFQGAFHGRTHYAMALTASKTVYRGHFEPLPGGVFHSQFCLPVPHASRRGPDRLRPRCTSTWCCAGTSPPTTWRRSSSSRSRARVATSCRPRSSCRPCARRPTRSARCSSWTRYRRAWGARASGSATSTTTSPPTSSRSPRASRPASRSGPSSRAPTSTTSTRPDRWAAPSAATWSPAPPASPPSTPCVTRAWSRTRSSRARSCARAARAAEGLPADG